MRLLTILTIFFVFVCALHADAETVRWEDSQPTDPQRWWDVGEVSWPGVTERFRIQICSVYPCLRSVVTKADIPPAVDVKIRTRSDNGWSGFSNTQQYWECKDVAGADGIVGVADLSAARQLGGVEGFNAWARFFTQTC